MTASHNRPSLTADRMLDPRVIDPRQELVDYSTMGEAEIAQVTRVLVGMRLWRESEEAFSFKSRNHMRLNENDMKALRFLVVSQNQNAVATPGALAEHLSISSASTTKLLDRLAAGGHIERQPHPTDRRALMITITTRTHEQVRETVGRTHALRFEAVARLTPTEREVVIRFLSDLSRTPDEAQDAADPVGATLPAPTPERNARGR